MRYAGAACLPTASSDPGAHANTPFGFASVPATTHGLSLPTGPPCRARLDLVIEGVFVPVLAGGPELITLPSITEP